MVQVVVNEAKRENRTPSMVADVGVGMAGDRGMDDCGPSLGRTFHRMVSFLGELRSSCGRRHRPARLWPVDRGGTCSRLLLPCGSLLYCLGQDGKPFDSHRWQFRIGLHLSQALSGSAVGELGESQVKICYINV